MFSVDVAIRHLRGLADRAVFGMLVFLPKIGILPDKARGRRMKMGRGRRCSNILNRKEVLYFFCSNYFYLSINNILFVICKISAL